MSQNLHFRNCVPQDTFLECPIKWPLWHHIHFHDITYSALYHHNFITCCYFCVCRCSYSVRPLEMMWGSRGSFSSQFSLLRYEIGSNVLLVFSKRKRASIWKWKYEKMNGPFCKITGPSISLIIKGGGGDPDYLSPNTEGLLYPS